MTCSPPRQLCRRGFTLVEVLIVVVILGILASVVLPYFATTAKADAGESVLVMNLAQVRMAIQRYKAFHSGRNPGQVSDGTNAAGTEQAFKRQLLFPTDRVGNVVPASGGPGVFGPFILGQLPPLTVGALEGQRNVSMVDATGKLQPDANRTHAWKYNSRTGEFICNSTESSSKGIPLWNF